MIIYTYKGQYLSKSDYIFTRTITDDESLLQKSIQLHEELKNALFNERTINEGMNFINFLQTYYTNNEIIGIWNTMERISPVLIDSGMKFFRVIDERLLFSNFQKVENNFIVLFTEFVSLKTMEKEWLKTHPRDFSDYSMNNIDYCPV